MLPSVHDGRLISYEVECEARTITLRTERREKGTAEQFANIILTGVQAYHFRNDAFGNIIFGLEKVPIELFLKEHAAEILASYRMAGSPGPWAKDLVDAARHLGQEKAQAFVLSSSYGLDGWILAREVSVVPVQT
jgi:hypothetical protein